MKWPILLLTIFIVGCSEEFTMTDSSNQNTKEAYFAGGCFWCIESSMEKVDGVIQAISGFSGGQEQSPSYNDVASGETSHTETVKVIYDANKVSYKELVDKFWTQHDPTDKDGQFADRGAQYRPAIFYQNDEEKSLAEQSRQELIGKGVFEEDIVTEITQFSNFFEAEDYHQDYYKKNPVRYKLYRAGSGRDHFLRNTWENVKDSSKDDLKERLTPMQYKVTQQDGTEPPFQNEYWDNTEEGIYVDIVDGAPLFSSKDKFKSGTGWPSFTKPLIDDNIVEKKDFKLVVPRTEIRSKDADSHLGHVFNDGPEPTGLRYCMNSASLKFIPVADLEKEGYGEFLDHFKEE